MNERLELISGEERLVLDSNDGQETLCQAKEVFRYIYSNFKHWRCDVAPPATNKNAVRSTKWSGTAPLRNCSVVLA
jgi:hypothetical protein